MIQPAIHSGPLPAFAIADIAVVREAFRGATPIPLRQAWLDTPEARFAPGIVRTGWRGDSLLVFAELTDEDVFTRAQRHNDRFWELGDTFEVFLQPEGDRAYVELHVTPNNLRLQLRFASPPTGAGTDPFAAALIANNIFKSRTWVAPEVRAWSVFAEIPAASVIGAPALSAESPFALAGSRWRFSFSRYDYTRGQEQPIISSSSPHTAPAFHRPHEWGTLRFAW